MDGISSVRKDVMDDKKVFDSLKGGRPDLRDESSGGFHYEKPETPAITVRDRADKTRPVHEYEEPTIPDKNYSRHLHKPAAAAAIAPRNPKEIESNEWRPFNTAKGGVSNVLDEDAGKSGVHNYEAPEIPDLDYEKHFPGRKR
jgi:hypothetical protein